MKNGVTEVSKDIETKIKRHVDSLSSTSSQVDFNNIEDYVARLAGNVACGEFLLRESAHYRQATVDLKNKINPQDYYYIVAREVKVATYILGVKGHPKYKTVHEREFNHNLYNDHITTAESWTNEANRIQLTIEEPQLRTKEYYDSAIQQIRAKTSELKAKTQEINTSVQNNLYQLDAIFQQNAALKSETTQNAKELQEIRNSLVVNNHKIHELPQQIMAIKVEAMEQARNLEMINEESIILYEQIGMQEQQEINFLSNLSITKRTEHFAQIFSQIQPSHDCKNETKKALQRKLKILEIKGIDYEYLTFIAIQTQDKELLKVALSNVSDLEQTLFNNTNLVQLALQSGNSEIIELVLDKSTSLIDQNYVNKFEISLSLMLENNDDVSLLTLMEAKGVELNNAIKSILENAAHTLNYQAINKILSLFPNFKSDNINNEKENIFEILLQTVLRNEELIEEVKQIISVNNIDIVSNIEKLFVKLSAPVESETSYHNNFLIKEINLALQLFPESQYDFEHRLKNYQELTNKVFFAQYKEEQLYSEEADAIEAFLSSFTMGEGSELNFYEHYEQIQ